MTSSFISALKDAGQSVTRPRLEVFEALHRAGEPISPAQLAGMVPGSDRASVYRTLALFRRLGFVRDVSAGFKQLVELGDRFDPHHHHLVCTGCGAAVVLEDEAVEAQLVRLAATRGYALQTHQLELTGRCRKCQAAPV